MIGDYDGGNVGGGREEDEEVKDRSDKCGRAVHSKQLYVPKYMSATSDMLWASKGVVVTVLTGEAIPVLQ